MNPPAGRHSQVVAHIAATSVMERLVRRANLTPAPSVSDVVSAVQAIPYGRPTERTVDCALAEWRGTCTTKHAVLLAALNERWPQLQPRPVHRVYRITPSDALRRFGADVAACVPQRGLVDVHRFCVIKIDGADLVLDITFPDSPPWSGHSSMELQCGPGVDHPATDDADADAAKRALEERHCDPDVREPFIAALARRTQQDVPSGKPSQVHRG